MKRENEINKYINCKDKILRIINNKEINLSNNYKVSIKSLILLLFLIKPILMFQKNENKLRKMPSNINSKIIIRIGQGINKILSDKFNIENYPHKVFINGELINTTFDITINKSFTKNNNTFNININDSLINNNSNETFYLAYNEFFLKMIIMKL